MKDFIELESDSLTGDRIEVDAYDGKIHIRIENPWAGDSETGFGRSAHLSLNRKQTIKLIKYLTKWVAQ